MNLQELNNIDLNNTGSLPLPVKALLLGILLLVLVIGGYWFFWSPSLDELDQAKAKEVELRGTFLAKKRQAINLEGYKQQMVEIERTFGALVKQLPDRSQMDGLLTDINQAGLEQGLEFELFKPGHEVIADFYAEMPISIKVTGSYHDLGAFATDIARLPRIVTLNDIVINAPAKDSKDGRLVIEAVAKTYRYLDANEIASKKQAEKKEAKK
ncbi:type 4a pilus biogenesis protein PilO [Methylobacillus gramineus]|uniref:type 4a pilus biogenesis protein PilO n=1 Tax=Methylobacillus gramineus TaxID=755169 RepID=UPI001CFF5B99|nr:type 4a pilus biogenesis protein PilO [Methylobacillus gramineus]MCB5186007.1 type 4a pilus biogenesis protein PilO [Methylobacillus gramineus]